MFHRAGSIMEVAAASSIVSRQVTKQVTDKRARSRVSNGRDMLPDIDGRSIVARRYRDIASAILVDQGGVDRCSESRIQLIRRFAAAAVLAEQLESRLANGEQIDIAEHATLSSTLVRLAQRIGIDRVARDISPSLGDLLRQDILDRQAEGAVNGEAGREPETRASGHAKLDSAYPRGEP
jgi:hypothetical protein